MSRQREFEKNTPEQFRKFMNEYPDFKEIQHCSFYGPEVAAGETRESISFNGERFQISKTVVEKRKLLIVEIIHQFGIETYQQDSSTATHLICEFYNS